MARAPREDWAQLLERLSEGDQIALVRLTRLVGGFFARWNAYDFRDDWEDLIQEVLIAALSAHEEGRIRERAHVYGFLKTIARNKFVDRLKQHLRSPDDQRLAWEDVIDGELDPALEVDAPDLSRDMSEMLAALEERRRRCVIAVHIEGRTLQEAAQSTGIPLGSLRRYLREGLAELRAGFAPGQTIGPVSDPTARTNPPGEEEA